MSGFATVMNGLKFTILCTVYLERPWDCLRKFFNYDFDCFDLRLNSIESLKFQKGY